MTRSPRRRFAAALVAVAASGLAMSACSNGDAAAVTASMESSPRPAAPVLPDVSIPEDIPGPAELQECADLTAAYAEVVVLALSGDDQGQLPGLFDQLEAAAPEDVLDDLAIVRRTTTEAAQGGLLDATGALLDQEYTDANAAVLDWLSAACTGGGG